MTKDKKQTVVWQERLAHNSCLKVDSVTNATYKHAVPPRPKGETDCKRWSMVCRNLASSIRKDPTKVQSAGYKVTSSAKLVEWGFPEGFDFPWATDSQWVITWKDGTTEHLVESINIRECRFERSRRKNEAYDARSLEQLEDMFKWAEDEDNGVPLGETSKKYHRTKLAELVGGAPEGGGDGGGSGSGNESDEEDEGPMAELGT